AGCAGPAAGAGWPYPPPFTSAVVTGPAAVVRSARGPAQAGTVTARRQRMIDGDQAEGLRRWAKTLSVEPPSHAAPRTLMVLGLDRDSGSQRVTRVLQHWQAQGYDWVGDP